jgi:Amidohydrolase family
MKLKAVRSIACVSLILGLVYAGQAQMTQPAEPVTLFQNVRIFNGTSTSLSGSSNVLGRGNTIERISASAIPAPGGATMIDGNGRTLMPGLIDMHTHLGWMEIPMATALSSDFHYLALRSARGAEHMLMQGFTTARDLSGNVYGLKRAIDEGYAVGPRHHPDLGTRRLPADLRPAVADRAVALHGAVRRSGYC